MKKQHNIAILLMILLALFCNPLIAKNQQISIAILPFNNQASDSKQSYLGVILTENIINTLSKVPQLLVIAGQAASSTQSTQQLGKTLGTQFTLTGATELVDNRLKITATLSDTENADPLWIKRFEVEIDAIFDAQNRITQQVLKHLQLESATVENIDLSKTPTRNLEAYHQFLQGREFLQRFNQSDNRQAQDLLAKALALDPEFGLAQVYLGWTYLLQARNRWVENTDQARAQASKFAEQVLTADTNNVDALILAAQIPLDKGQRDKAIKLLRQAVRINPNHVNAAAILGINLAYRGNPEEGKQQLEKAIRLNPNHPAWYIWALGVTYFIEGNYGQAVATLEQYHQRNPDDFESQIDLAYAYVQVGRLDAAKSAVKATLKNNPNYTITRFADKFGSRYKDSVVIKTILANLHAAGLPE